MKINRENFEAYYLDFIESNLDQESIAELHSFLAKNPDIQIESDGLDVYLNYSQLDSLTLENKSLLKNLDWDKTSITHNNITNFQLARLDQLLTINKEKELRIFEETFPHWKHEKKLLNLTKLRPNNHILFLKKSRLKKPLFQSKTILVYSILSSAACIALFLIWRNRIVENQIQIPPTAKNKIFKTDERKIKPTDTLSLKKTTNLIEKTIVSNNSNSIISKKNKDSIPDKIQAIPVNIAEVNPVLNQKDSIIEKENSDVSNLTLTKNQPIVDSTKLTNNTSAKKPLELETRRFTLFSKLLSKYLNINFGVGKKVREETDEYYVYIGSFQVSRKISK
jgi:hypothetical protein